MIWLPLVVAAGIGYFIYSSSDRPCMLSCYNIDNLCWNDDKTPESCEELFAVRALACEGSMAYRLDPVKTAVSFLNRVFILDQYRSRPCLVEKVQCYCEKTYVLLSFDDGSHLACECIQPCLDCTKDIYAVSRYAYIPNCCR